MNALSELMRESVEDVAPAAPDPGRAAWDRATALRRRRTTAGVACLAAVAVAGTALVGSLRGSAPDGMPGPAGSPSASAGESGSAGPVQDPKGRAADARYRGFRVYWSPLPAEEAMLPVLDLGLPTEVDLSADSVTTPVDRATAAFAVLDDNGMARLLVLDDAGVLHSLDTSWIREMPDAGSPVTSGMLSPDGTQVAVRQPDGVVVVTLATGKRQVLAGTADAADAGWEDDGALAVFTDHRIVFDANLRRTALQVMPPVPLLRGDAQAYGPSFTSSDARTAAAFWSPTGMPLPETNATPSQVLAIGASDRADDLADGFVLVQTEDVPDDIRQKNCCEPAFWSGDRIVYQSRGDGHRLIAWTPGTHRFERVTTLTGATTGAETVIASFRSAGW